MPLIRENKKRELVEKRGSETSLDEVFKSLIDVSEDIHYLELHDNVERIDRALRKLRTSRDVLNNFYKRIKDVKLSIKEERKGKSKV